MKRFLYLVVIGLTASITFAPALAGSPGGLRLAVAFTGAAAPYAADVRAFFTRYDAGKTVSECEGSLLNIESAIFGIEAKQLGGDVALIAAGERRQRKQLGKFLTRHNGKTGTAGLDALLVVDKTDGLLKLRGVSAAPAYPLQATQVDLGAVGQPAKLDLAICKTLVQLPVMREP